jgi:hypothetical protein
MLDGSFFGKNGGRAASGVAAEKKNLFFFLRSFPERMFREAHGWRIPIHAARDVSCSKVSELMLFNNKCLKTPSFRQAPECP